MMARVKQRNRMAQITLLDGGMGQELIARSGDAPTPLWATRVMIDHPDLVRQVHADYFAAGATIATTNSYAIHHDRLVHQGLDHLFHSLHLRALMQAVEARDTHGSGRIAGSLGPLEASYRPDLTPALDVAAAKYAEIAALMAPHVDLFLIETSSSIAASEGALMGAGKARPVWLSVSVNDKDGTKLRSDEPLSGLARLVDTYRPAAILANCSVPEAMGAAMNILRGFGLPFGAYANGFTHITDNFKTDQPTVDDLFRRHDLTPDLYADFAMSWVAQGATIIGGCCEVGPAHIAALRDRLLAEGHVIV
jgi:S-methylmethionine-dependent homocysteine/selenocysteine methylase